MEKLIKHLEAMLKEENTRLTEMAVDAMESEELPFEGLNLHEKQKEYKLKQQRVFGILDTIEEVKAFQEGFFNKDQHIEGRDE